MINLLKYEEKIIFNLRQLYHRYGYSPFKMSKFEPYDLYVDKKDFLVSDGVITFTDTDGTLLALKPDVTLSIIKNYRSETGVVQKTYYNENVYRTAGSGQGYREILQTGLECVGQVDEAAVCEVILLAAKSLASISDQYVLDISHMGILEEILSPLSLNSEQKAAIMACLEEKNEDALRTLPFAVPEETMQQLATLLLTYGPLENVLEDSPALQKLRAFSELKSLGQTLRALGVSEHINLDFSIIGSRNYYNGLVFRGYIAGIPTGVLSGGQYDKLMRKMGKSAKGIGFAVYLNELDRLNDSAEIYDHDAVLLCENSSAEEALTAADQLRKEVSSLLVLPQLPQGIACRRLFVLKDGKVIEIV